MRAHAHDMSKRVKITLSINCDSVLEHHLIELFFVTMFVTSIYKTYALTAQTFHSKWKISKFVVI